MSRAVVMFVPGAPATQGSKTKGRWGMYDDNAKTLKPWRAAITTTTRNLREQPFTDAVEADITIILKRPPSHYRTGRNRHLVKDSAPAYPIGAGVGDADKFARACFDGIADGGLVANDSQIVEFAIRKRYINPEHPEPGAWIHLTDRISQEQDQAA